MRIGKIRDIGQDVDGCRHQDEEQHAPHAEGYHAAPCCIPPQDEHFLFGAGQLFCRGENRRGTVRHAQVPYTCPEEQHGQPGSGIHANPLAGNAAAHEQSAQGQVRQQFLQRLSNNVPLHKPRHEQIFQHDEQNREAVDGGNACLGQVHAVQGHDGHGRKGHIRALGQLFAKQIQGRQHQDAHQRPGKAPPEGRHAEDGDKPAHDDLAQRRMAGFIGRLAVKMLVGGAGVIDFVEIGAVVPAWLALQRVLFVKQRFWVGQKGRCIVGVQRANNRCVNTRPIAAAEDDLVEDEADLLSGNADIPAGQPLHIRGILRADICPPPIRGFIAGHKIFPAIALALIHLRPILL